MSDSKTICIPSLSLNYEDNMLESIGMGGELYHREQRDWRAISRAHEQTIDRMGAENAELRKLAVGLNWCSEHRSCCYDYDEGFCCPLYRPDAVGDERYGCEALKSELGIEVDE